MKTEFSRTLRAMKLAIKGHIATSRLSGDFEQEVLHFENLRALQITEELEEALEWENFSENCEILDDGEGNSKS